MSAPSPATELSPSPRPRDLADLPTRELFEALVNPGYAGHPWDELKRGRLVGRTLLAAATAKFRPAQNGERSAACSATLFQSLRSESGWAWTGAPYGTRASDF